MSGPVLNCAQKQWCVYRYEQCLLRFSALCFHKARPSLMLGEEGQYLCLFVFQVVVSVLSCKHKALNTQSMSDGLSSAQFLSSNKERRAWLSTLNINNQFSQFCLGRFSHFIGSKTSTFLSFQCALLLRFSHYSLHIFFILQF